METFGEMKWKRYINLLLWEGHDKAPEGPSSETPGADSQDRTNISFGKIGWGKSLQDEQNSSCAFTLIRTAPEWLAVLSFDWPEKYFCGQSVQSISCITFVPFYIKLVIAINSCIYKCCLLN